MRLTSSDTFTCEMSARLFGLSVKRGYDSVDFVDKLMHSELAEHLYKKDQSPMWLGEAYLLSTLETECTIKQGPSYDLDMMEWAGWLFKYWSIAYPDETPMNIYTQAPIEKLNTMYIGLHVMSPDLQIEDIKELYKENQN
ncbi:hypothetical protein SAMN02745229_03186 [Butyrivibrio fibrisolvens DSM 3071]|uniref:Uncharacterized protein n=1 Tax=Butyrivibrio fibrisolvens DSM 3071 TaxID=1121131 RepID=A0A1M6BLV8_BUTFI|nr:hypothetical protein [Butyrivibrio fibrisolvens]SHI49637.1 hypothetical protein SAMN02745229_03186 [Butyrivibrio fibrisolvens DSM 3071]